VPLSGSGLRWRRWERSGAGRSDCELGQKLRPTKARDPPSIKAQRGVAVEAAAFSSCSFAREALECADGPALGAARRVEAAARAAGGALALTLMPTTGLNR